MVFMAQNFSLRYPLISWHGNVGNQQGDPAAAYRYTEARLSPIGELMLEDIDKDTVDMVDNYDNTTKEPIVLGGYFPNAIVNPAMGIAVGIATTFAPHYLKDVINASCLMIHNMIQDKLSHFHNYMELMIHLYLFLAFYEFLFAASYLPLAKPLANVL